MNKRKLVSVMLSAALAISGCTSKRFDDVKAQADSVHDEIVKTTTIPKRSKVANIERPPVSIIPLKKEIRIDWLDEYVSIKANDIPLSLAISQVMNGEDISIWFDGDVDPNSSVTLAYSGKREDVLNLIASQTKLGIKPLPNKLEIRKFESETFVINVPPGKYSGQQGSQGKNAADSKGAIKVEGQYLNVAFTEVDPINELSKGIEGILKKDGGKEGELVGSINAIPAMTLVTVRTTPSRMTEVRKLVAEFQDELNKQVVIDIRVLEFRSNLGHERGIDWEAVKNVGEGTLKFYVPGTNVLSANSLSGVAFEGSGKWDGTSALIKVLEKQGSVATTTPVSQTVLNNMPSRISQTMTRPNVSEIKSESNENVVSATATVEKQVEGVDMMVTPKVGRDFVWLRVSGKLTKNVGERKQVIANNELTFIDTRESEINFTNKLRYGQTVVLGSVRQTSTTAEVSSQFGTNALGGEGTQKSVVETLVLLTPRSAQ